eukprot:CAMPEP_0170179780 /NCGR_PEP_ID=MMETSP0040_2-20121228/19159_1 /TAXON_ID=641309 /ORGANISM="Lotharella oceanica, Strain CCMP622" /LENGTH=106 /DNA_ID=CAMNT_0010424075 /DNA_START=120 /DNA_END=441 /DNA_ORIENTATION=+
MSSFAHVALDKQFSEEDERKPDRKLCGGLPNILNGYFGTLLPCVCIEGKVLKADGIEKGESLHFYLQGAIEPPYDMDDDKGIVGCKPLNKRIQEIIQTAAKSVSDS